MTRGYPNGGANYHHFSDAIYHTSIVLGGREYYYGVPTSIPMIYMKQPTKAHTGQGIQFSIPGRTHHGNPMEKIHLGVTSLNDEIFLEYLDSLKPIYSPEAYDLFQHNCNNFTNDVAQFLCGRGIPDHIVSLPQTVLNTPFGQMLKPQLEQAMRPITTAPTPHAAYTQASRDAGQRPGASKVITANSLAALEKALSSAEASCAVVFFTSSTCGPCRSIYPRYEELAADAGSRAKLIKCDIGAAPDAALRYEINSTPTFVTFLKGEKVEEWVGASERDLQQRVDTLLRMAYPRKYLLGFYSRNELNPWFSPPAHGYQASHYLKHSHEADNIHQGPPPRQSHRKARGYWQNPHYTIYLRLYRNSEQQRRH